MNIQNRKSASRQLLLLAALTASLGLAACGKSEPAAAPAPTPPPAPVRQPPREVPPLEENPAPNPPPADANPPAEPKPGG